MRNVRSGFVLILHLPALLYVSGRRSSYRLAALRRQPRGGYSEPYEINPNYVPPSRNDEPSTLGDLERKRPVFQHQQHQEQQQHQAYTYVESNKSPLEQLVAYTTQLHRLSPTLSIGSASCIIIWLLWQRQKAQPLLRNNFVCSRFNVKHGRHWTTLTSAVSHASFTHLLVNLSAFLTFGPSIVQTLSRGGHCWKMWPLVVGAALFSSHVFLVLEKGGGCMGLSGVTLAFLAFTARVHPEQELGVLFMGVIPIRMPAQIALYALLAVSAIGSFVNTRSRVCHSAHLGGLLYGMAYYEIWIRRAGLGLRQSQSIRHK